MSSNDFNEEEQRQLEQLAETGWDDNDVEAEALAERRRKRKRAILEKFGNEEDISQLNNEVATNKVITTVDESSDQVKEKENGEDDGYDDDDDSSFDMFGADTPVSNGTKELRNISAASASGGVEDVSNWDDADGYYKATIGEVITVPLHLNNNYHDDIETKTVRYRVLGVIGKGVFSSVLKCCNLDDPNNLVALKLIRNNETMAKAAQKELRILKMLNSTKKANAHCIMILPGSGHEHRNHITMYFEIMHMNLRETLYKFGKGVGIQISAVRRYTRQLVLALTHLKEHGIVHADIKPDNILVNADFSVVKICDFGSAFFVTDVDAKDPTPYLVSRFYRPPEVILGMDYSHPVDLWSIAVSLAELFQGSVLFPGSTNNDMLRLFMESLGPFSNKILKRHFNSFEKLGLSPHFDRENYAFHYHDIDIVTGRPVLRTVSITSAKQSKTLPQLFLKSKSQSDDRLEVLRFADLLTRCLALDPARRMPLSDVLHHNFLNRSSQTAN